MNKSKIEWCDYTWNPCTGCLHGCEYCYARKIANRFKGYTTGGIMNLQEHKEETKELHVLAKNLWKAPKVLRSTQLNKAPYPFGFDPTFHKYRLIEPFLMNKPSKIFICSMADLFGEWVPDEWINEVFQSCSTATRHQYLFLTKNPERYDRALDYYENEERGFGFSEGLWDNTWFGTTVTCQADNERIWHLSVFSEGHKYLSVEPLLGEITLDLTGIQCPKCGSVNVYQDNPVTSKGLPPYYCDDCAEWEGDNPASCIEWVIVGQQTGPGAVPPKAEWVQSIIDQCKAVGVPVFLKNSLKALMGDKFIQEWPEEMDTSNK